ncbi:DUF4174 domain-containing protein [Rhizobiaceae bacterium CRRU44]|uniref:DUF4174 domain-containing protein n=1 Tax=Ferranicluibacter rubi TaxID=2715133 RepID=A0AA44C8X7_9HYPH|nr:DUF4174 domain-containing protein [Ferranicluibacter rubi]NHT74420.1 DUF4174 domain-containing protein [Ferranicluibacter rubi]
MIRSLKTVALTLLVATGTSAASAAGLDAFGWKNRVLIVFANPGDPDATEQRRLLVDDTKALADRDMVVLEVVGDTVKPIYGKAAAVTAQELRNDAGIDEGRRFTAILVGKDGGIKLRADKPVAPDQLFGLIDSMPMRANEASR